MTEVRAPWNNTPKTNNDGEKKMGNTQTKHGKVFIFAAIVILVTYYTLQTILGN